MNVTKLAEIYYAVDEFLIKFMPYMEKQLLTISQRKPTRTCWLSLSEIMTIIIAFHVIGFRNFKLYYLHLQQFHTSEFRNLVSYNRFIELIPRTLVPLFFLHKVFLKRKQVITLWMLQLPRFAISKEPIVIRSLRRLL